MRPHLSAGRRPVSGFTLIELVLVLGILAISATLVLPLVGRGTESLRLRREAGRVAALLREARLEAVRHHQPTRVSLDVARNTVALTANDTRARQIELSAGLHVRVAAGGETLTFSPRGLTRQTRWILEGPGGRRLAIEVDGVSGRVTVAPETSG